MKEEFSQRLSRVDARITRAAEASGRNRSDITLIAVGKTFSSDVVADAVRGGATDLGENRVQEAHGKKPSVPSATWHLIGPLQRNKVRPALETFDVIHTLDRPRLAERLQRLLEQDWPERRLRVLIEVNLGGEKQKAGAGESEVSELLSIARDCDRLVVEGLMAIPPFSSDAELTRPYFRQLRMLRDRLQESHGDPLPHLSMGMSSDFEVAIEEGATMVRVGTALFGRRT